MDDNNPVSEKIVKPDMTDEMITQSKNLTNKYIGKLNVAFNFSSGENRQITDDDMNKLKTAINNGKTKFNKTDTANEFKKKILVVDKIMSELLDEAVSMTKQIIQTHRKTDGMTGGRRFRFIEILFLLFYPACAGVTGYGIARILDTMPQDGSVDIEKSVYVGLLSLLVVGFLALECIIIRAMNTGMSAIEIVPGEDPAPELPIAEEAEPIDAEEIDLGFPYDNRRIIEAVNLDSDYHNPEIFLPEDIRAVAYADYVSEGIAFIPNVEDLILDYIGETPSDTNGRKTALSIFIEALPNLSESTLSVPNENLRQTIEDFTKIIDYLNGQLSAGSDSSEQPEQPRQAESTEDKPLEQRIASIIPSTIAIVNRNLPRPNGVSPYSLPPRGGMRMNRRKRNMKTRMRSRKTQKGQPARNRRTQKPQPVRRRRTHRRKHRRTRK
jgi:hypothetical protein